MSKPSRDAVEFIQTLNEPSIGFGYVYTKVVRLTPGKPQMTIAHVMRNTGSKPIVTNVYNHNFTTIDKQPTGPDVEVTVPWQMTRAASGRGAGPRAQSKAALPERRPHPRTARANRRSIRAAPLAAGERMGTQCSQAQMRSLADPQGNKLVYKKVLEGSECYSASFTGFGADAKDNDIRIENKKVGRGRAHYGRSAVDALRVSSGGVRTVLAPEPYIDLNIEPGQQFAWTYTYEYYTTK